MERGKLDVLGMLIIYGRRTTIPAALECRRCELCMLYRGKWRPTSRKTARRARVPSLVESHRFSCVRGYDPAGLACICDAASGGLGPASAVDPEPELRGHGGGR